ncbi:glutathione S-transferase [Zoogloea ramigera]|uniref:Glutathione S-transferase n=1 Tax=Zoogloea ramigera TaxID=350 RepID=A0A4Y4CXN6_ZOORA|nr:glutathione S-transferase [Zoogloea ramigera]GEC96254.1 glutathione S-transferase [Zoogloea ramigera]
MKLVASLTSPYARKIRVALAEKNLPFELEVDIPWLADTRVPSYNPLGKVPALVADDGELWFDSPVIAEYLDTLAGPLLLPADRAAALPVRQAEALADGITDAAVAAFLEGMRPAERQDPAAIERQLGKISRGLTALEARVAQRKGCAGEALSIADIAIGCTLGYLDLRFAHLGWRAAHPQLAAWAAGLLARPSFTTTAPPAA